MRILLQKRCQVITRSKYVWYCELIDLLTLSLEDNDLTYQINRAFSINTSSITHSMECVFHLFNDYAKNHEYDFTTNCYQKLISTRESFTAQFALVIVFQYFMKLFFLRLECQTPVKG